MSTIAAEEERRLVSGDLCESAVQAWLEFISIPIHERCLKLRWMAVSRAEAAVLWRFCEHHRLIMELGTERSYRKISAKEISVRFGEVFGCSRSAIGTAMSDLLDAGVLRTKPHVDNVTRKIWLDWTVLHARWQGCDFPELDFLELNWIARNKAEVSVLHALRVAGGDAVKLSVRELERQYRAKLGAGVDSSSISRAMKSLLATGMIERADDGVGHCFVLGKVDQLLRAYYSLDLDKLPVGRVLGVK